MDLKFTIWMSWNDFSNIVFDIASHNAISIKMAWKICNISVWQGHSRIMEPIKGTFSHMTSINY